MPQSAPVTAVPAATREADLVGAVVGLLRSASLLERTSSTLTISQFKVLAAIAAGNERAARIAERLAVGKPTVSAAVETLTQKGYVTRAAVKEDNRAAALSLTPAGHQILQTAHSELSSRLDQLLGFTDDPQEAARVLGQLSSAVEAWRAQGTTGHDELAAKRKEKP